jgi:branched-chain amino acid transport system permease protein
VFVVAHHVLSEMTPQFWQFWIGAALVALALAGRGGILGLLAAALRRGRA